MEQRSPEWFEARKGKITGSRVGAILGVNPYKSRDDVMREMVREWFGAEKEFNGNEATAHGEKMEPEALAYYKTMLDDDVESVAEVGLIVHPLFTFIGASPDGVLMMKPGANRRGGLEIKCPYWAKEPYSVHDPKKASYAAQCQLVMACCDFDYMDFLCYFSPRKNLLETIERDYEWWDTSLPILEEFHHEFQDIVASRKRSAPYLAPPKTPITEIDDPRMAELARLFRNVATSDARVAADRKAFDKLKKEIAAEYGAGKAEGIQFETQKKRGSIDWEGLGEAIGLPDILQERGLALEDFRKADTSSVIVKELVGEA